MLYIEFLDDPRVKAIFQNGDRGTVWPIVEVPFSTDRHMNESAPTSLRNLPASEFFEGV